MIIAIVNIKGGTSKTTSAIALACAACASGHAVRVLDADPQGSATEWALVASDAGSPLPFEVASANIASVRRLRDDGAMTFVDCPPSGAVTDEAITRADFVIVPTSPAPIDLAKTREVVTVLESQGKAHGVLLTRVTPNTLSYRHALDELADVSTFECHIPKREAVVAMFGKPFANEFFGYDDVLAEIEASLDD